MWDLHVTCEIYFIGSYEHIFDWENRNMFSLEIKWPVSYFVCVNVCAACGRLFGFLGCKRAHVSVFNVVIGFLLLLLFCCFFSVHVNACECWCINAPQIFVWMCVYIFYLCARVNRAEEGGCVSTSLSIDEKLRINAAANDHDNNQIVDASDVAYDLNHNYDTNGM